MKSGYFGLSAAVSLSVKPAAVIRKLIIFFLISFDFNSVKNNNAEMTQGYIKKKQLSLLVNISLSSFSTSTPKWKQTDTAQWLSNFACSMSSRIPLLIFGWPVISLDKRVA